MVSVLQVLLGLLTALLMMGLGATVRQQDLSRIRTHWKAPLLGFACQYLAMPLLAFLLGLALGVSDVVLVSMVAIGCTPGGSTSNLFTLYSKGDVALSIAMTVLSTLLAFGMMPLLLLIYTSHITSDLRIPFLDILTALLLVLVPAGLGILLRRYSMVWAKRVAIFASGLGVLFILAALIFGSISETAIWKAPWQLFVSSAVLLLLGAAVGYASAHFSGFPRRQARTIALETGIQNSTFTITVLTFSFGGEGQDTEVFNEVLLFPLLYSFFLIVDGILLTALFHYLARFDPEEEKAAYADEEAKRAAELEAEEAGQAGGEGDAQPGEGTQLVVVGAATPTGGESPSAASEGTDSEGKDVEQGTSGVASAGAAASEDVEEEDLDTGVEGEKGAKAPPAEGDGEGEATSSTTEEVEAPVPGSGDSTRRASAVEVSEETASDNPLASEDGGDVEEWGGTAAAAEP